MIHERMEIKVPDASDTAILYTYLWSNSEELYNGLTRPVILICPGGAYAMTSDREAEGIALKFMAMGYHAAVLRYSVAPAVYPTALLQAAAAVQILRERAKEWYIDPDKIIVQGSSAGGHLAASLGVFWKKKELWKLLGTDAWLTKPNGLILSYPVITSGVYGHRESFRNLLGGSGNELEREMSLELQVDRDTPKTFIWHTFEDQTVPVENSLLFVEALRRNGIPTEFHLFPRGIHGLGTAGRLSMSMDGRGIQKECEIWMQLAGAWVDTMIP